MYPLRFKPIFRRYIWGGEKLGTILNKPIGNESCAESWEIVDHNEDQSVVLYGDLAGRTLRQLVENHGIPLLGEAALAQMNDASLPAQLRGRFPLLLKFLDANHNLSVQVHPDDKIGATLSPPDLGKTEAWYVMSADAGAKIYAGLKPGIDAEQLRESIGKGATESVLHSFEPQAGDCVFIKAGTLHAIGAGLLIAEIQQASDTTYRVFDWNRVDKDGKPRELHIDESIRATNFNGPVDVVSPRPTEWENATTIVESTKFVMRRWKLEQPACIDDSKLHIVAVTSGQVQIEGEPSGELLGPGETALIPASCRPVNITPQPNAEFLDIFLPE